MDFIFIFMVFVFVVVLINREGQVSVEWKTGQVKGDSLQTEHLRFSLPSLKSVVIAPLTAGAKVRVASVGA